MKKAGYTLPVAYGSEKSLDAPPSASRVHTIYS
jgi:hypothetical protein